MASQFNSVPTIRHKRSRFDLSHSVKTSGSVGTLYPFEVQEVYAGDTFKVDTACVSRLSSNFIRPVVDNLFLDIYYFYVPSRLLYDKFVNIFGENTESAWANTVEYTVPAVPSGLVYSKSVADYMGLPVNLNANSNGVNPINILPFRAFAKIYNEWFRDENIIDPMHIQTGESTSSEAFNNNDWSPSNYTGKLPKVAKLHDYFTSCLPAPQKGSVVDIFPVSLPEQVLPVYADLNGNEIPSTTKIKSGAIRFQRSDSSIFPNSPTPLGVSPHVPLTGGSSLTRGDLVYLPSGSTGQADQPIFPVNMWVDSSGVSLGSVSVNDLRFAFQYQKMLERDARSGTRYTEYIAAHFGVNAGDYRLQRSEFLGGRRSPITITQVTQTTGSTESDPSSEPTLGSVAAYSLSNSRSRFTKGFVEHGYVIGVFCIRQFHSYQQGVERFWSRIKRTDFFDPVFSHIGEQPVYQQEIFADLTGKSTVKPILGYNEAWADLRYRPNRITGQMRSGLSISYDVWHFADYYANAPSLTPSWIEETPDYVDRTIAVDSTVSDQFLFDFYVKSVAYRPMPTYSVPSLIDHD